MIAHTQGFGDGSLSVSVTPVPLPAGAPAEPNTPLLLRAKFRVLPCKMLPRFDHP
jgi:hypothetical protein